MPRPLSLSAAVAVASGAPAIVRTGEDVRSIVRLTGVGHHIADIDANGSPPAVPVTALGSERSAGIDRFFDVAGAA